MSDVVAPGTMPVNFRFLVDQHPHISDKGVDELWGGIQAHFSPRNNLAAIDWASFRALTPEQRGEINKRWIEAVGYEPSFVKADNCNTVFMGGRQLLDQMADINESSHRSSVLKAIEIVGQERIPAETRIYRRGEGPAWTPQQVGQIIFGPNQVYWNAQWQMPAAPAQVGAQVPVVAPATAPTTATTLVCNVAGSRRRAIKRANKIPRPPNSWIIYRADKQKAVTRANPNAGNNQISSIISGMWANESVEVRKQYAAFAEIAKINHAIEYPQYSYKPRHASTIKRRRGYARADAVTLPIETFEESEEILTDINGSLNMIENSTQYVGGYDATVYQDEDPALGLLNPARYDWY